MRDLRISLAGAQLAVRVDDRRTERILGSWPYRRVVAPTLRRLGRLGNAHPSDSRSMYLTPAPRGVPVYYPRPLALPRETADQRAIVERVEQHEWYQTIELGHGVRTPGAFDHGPALPHFPLPENLAGKRCLDVATADGFWAFEMERRGAAEVVALDIESWRDLDIPPHVRDGLPASALAIISPTGSRFQLAADLLGSRVRRQICNVYDLSPAIVGQFDLVMSGDLLLHLTNPHRALQNIRAVTRGEAIIVEPNVVALDALDVGPVVHLVGIAERAGWWGFSRSFLEKAIRLAGFADVEACDMVDMRLRLVPNLPMPRAVFRAFPAGRPA